LPKVRGLQSLWRELFFMRHENGKLAPYTADAVNHFINCRKADWFRN
jgi:hypothetical protein